MLLLLLFFSTTTLFLLSLHLSGFLLLTFFIHLLKFMKWSEWRKMTINPSCNLHLDSRCFSLRSLSLSLSLHSCLFF
jgi:hypothetical protein